MNLDVDSEHEGILSGEESEIDHQLQNSSDKTSLVERSVTCLFAHMAG